MALAAATFLILNRQAYQGYFQDDEINSMAWTRWGPVTDFLKGALTPVFAGSFRAVGFFYFRVTEKLFGLHFPGYVAVIHAIHLWNVWMVWLLIRKLGTAAPAACAGTAFFALHMALFDVFWKPMFVFDLLCGSFCLASMLLWIRGNWIASFAAFWLAYRSKEVAVMLPLVLAWYEVWSGRRRWAPLVPFAAASLWFAVQALVLSPVEAPAYRFHWSRGALAQTVPFYAGRVFLAPYAGFLLPVAAAVARSRRAWFGLGMMALFFFPLVCLPGRIFSAYCYVPFIGLAVALAGLAERVKMPAMTVLLVAWMALDIHSLRAQSAVTLRQDRDIREWMTAAGHFARSRPEVHEYVYDGLPEGFYPFGAEATLRYYRRTLDVPLAPAGSPEEAGFGRNGPVALLRWDGHRLEIGMR